MEYPQKRRLVQKRTIGDQEQANNASVSAEQTNIVSKFVQNAQPSSNFCRTCGKCFKEIYYLIDVTNTSQCRKGLNWRRLVQHNSYEFEKKTKQDKGDRTNYMYMCQKFISLESRFSSGLH